MDNSYPNEECGGRVKSSFHFWGVLVYESIIDNDKDHNDEGEDVSITPKYNFVIRKAFDLQKVLVKEVEATQEQDTLEHQTVNIEHIRGKLEVVWVMLLDIV